MTQQQNEVWEAHVGNSRTFSVYLEDPPIDPADSGPGTPITGAEVYFSLYDENGSTVSGPLWPVPMVEQGSPGWYEYVAPSTVQWQHLRAYYAQIDYAGEVKAVPPIVAYDRTLQQPTQSQLRAIALKAGLSL